jgi:hypothetical protein
MIQNRDESALFSPFLFFQSPQLIQVNTEPANIIFHISLNNFSHSGIRAMELILDDGIGSLTLRCHDNFNVYRGSRKNSIIQGSY